MIFGNQLPKPDLKRIRLIKRALYNVLQLQKGTIVTLSELACLGADCAPIKTSFGLLRANEMPLQHVIHKCIEDITTEDLVQVSFAWGFKVQRSDFELFFDQTYLSK